MLYCYCLFDIFMKIKFKYIALIGDTEQVVKIDYFWKIESYLLDFVNYYTCWIKRILIWNFSKPWMRVWLKKKFSSWLWRILMKNTAVNVMWMHSIPSTAIYSFPIQRCLSLLCLTVVDLVVEEVIKVMTKK